MKTFVLQIEDKTVNIKCDEKLKNAVDALFEVLKGLQAQRNIFDEEFILCAGWSYYFFKEYEDHWQILAPDFKKDPNKYRTDNLTVPLMVQNLQSETLNTAGVKPETGGVPVNFRNTMLVLKDAMTAKNVYFNRTEPESENDSGWYMGLMGDENEDHQPEDYALVQTSELLKVRPLALRIFGMPVGTLAVFDGNLMTALVDKDNTPLKFTVDGNENKGRT